MVSMTKVLLVVITFAVLGLPGCMALERRAESLPTKQPAGTADSTIMLPGIDLRIVPMNRHILAFVGVLVPVIPLWSGDSTGDLAWILIEAKPVNGSLAFTPGNTILITAEKEYAPIRFSQSIPVGEECNELHQDRYVSSDKQIITSESICLAIAYQLPTSLSLDQPFALSIRDISLNEKIIIVPPINFKKAITWDFHAM